MQFPILSFIVFTPIIAGMLILLIPAERKSEIRMAALAAGAFALLLSIWAYFSYDITAGGYQFVEKYTWLPALGISYHVGMDGINGPLVLLTGIVMFTGVLIVYPGYRCLWSFRNPRSFHAVLLLRNRSFPNVLIDIDLGLESHP
jgi:NADH-quinone oxidoreductase subunit M